MTDKSAAIAAYCAAIPATNTNTIKVYGGHDGTAVLQVVDDPAWAVIETDTICWYYGKGVGDSWDMYWTKGSLPKRTA